MKKIVAGLRWYGTPVGQHQAYLRIKESTVEELIDNWESPFRWEYTNSQAYNFFW